MRRFVLPEQAQHVAIFFTIFVNIFHSFCQYFSQYLSQGSVRRFVLPEQAQPVPGAAWGALEKRPRLSRLSSRHISSNTNNFKTQAWVSRALNTH